MGPRLDVTIPGVKISPNPKYIHLINILYFCAYYTVYIRIYIRKAEELHKHEQN